MNDIKLLKENKENKSTDKFINEFNNYLQGKDSYGLNLENNNELNLTAKQAFHIIYYLQEHLPVIPDIYEKCDNCDSIYNGFSEGYYSEKGNEIGHHFCGACDHLIED